MKHEKEIDSILRELLYESWMSEKDYLEVLDMSLKMIDTTKQSLSNDIETGVKNGYSVGQQMEMLKQILSNVFL